MKAFPAFRSLASMRWMLVVMLLALATILISCSDQSSSSGESSPLGGSSGNAAQGAEIPDNTSSRPEAPTVELMSLDDNELLETSTIDKPILYAFWASWCNYCQNEIPMIDALYPEYKDQVEFISVNITHQDSMKDVRGFVEEHELSMPVYLDLDGIASTTLGILSVPTVVLVDQDGRLADKKIGASADKTGEEYRQKLEELLNDG